MHNLELYQCRKLIVPYFIRIIVAWCIDAWKIWTQKSFRPIKFLKRPPTISVIVHYFLCLHVKYSKTFFFKLWRLNAKSWFKKSRMIITFVLSIDRSMNLLVENDKANVQSLMSQENDVLQIKSILNDNMEKNMQQPALMIGSRSCLTCMILAPRNMQKTFFDLSRAEVLNWMG